MRNPYVYPHTNILKNLANIQDEKELSYMEQNIPVYDLQNL